MLHASGPLDQSSRCVRVFLTTWTNCAIHGDVPIAIMRRAQHHRPNIGRCASCCIGHFPRSSTRLCTRRITSSAIQMQIASAHGTIACAICMSITVEHCKSASANFDSLQPSGSTAVTCLDFVSSRQYQRHRGKPEHNDEIPLL